MGDSRERTSQTTFLAMIKISTLLALFVAGLAHADDTNLATVVAAFNAANVYEQTQGFLLLY